MDSVTPQTRPCPKHMTYGPCGGVSADGSCEIDPDPCAFIDRGVVQWVGSAHNPGEGDDPLLLKARDRATRGSSAPPLVVAGAPVGTPDSHHLHRIAEVACGQVDALLFGDANWARVQLSPSFRARVINSAGVRPWATLNCRDRNRVALEGELLGLAEENAAVLCVTGDHPASGHRPDAAGVFDLDSTELAALARATGIEVVAVAGSPGVEPTAIRPGRLAQKALAGAQVCFINNANEPQDVVDYIRSCLACGADGVAFIVCIPVLATASSRTMTSSFANFRAPALSNDPIESALLHARAMLDCDGVGGVHLEAHGAPHEIDEAISAVMKVAGEIG